MKKTPTDGKSPSMLGRLMHLLIALMLALAATTPVSVRAMPMATGVVGPALQQHCPNCLQHQSSNTQTDKMTVCPGVACTGSAVVRPSRTLIFGQVFPQATYVKAPIVGWAEAALTPDPFPPRPIVLL